MFLLLLFALLHFLEDKGLYNMLSMCLPFQVLERPNNFREIWYKFYTSRSIEKYVCVVIFPYYTSQTQRHILYKTKFHFYCNWKLQHKIS